MLITAFFGWWYGAGWKHAVESAGPRLKHIAELFSVKQLLKTLFQPWRRIVSVPGASLEDKLHAWGDNLISRMVGFVVRICVLLAASLSIIVVAALIAVEIVAWPLLPIAAPVLIVKGLL